MPSTFTVEQRGVGKPDYSKEVSLGRIRPGLTLKYNQSLKVFGIVNSAIPSPLVSWVAGLLAVGATEHVVDWETGLASPFTVPQGYIATVISGSYGFGQDAILRMYYDTALTSSLGLPAGGDGIYVDPILGWGTFLLDPIGEKAHLYDIQITNQGTADLEGTGTVIAVLEAVGTKPLPTTKEIRCKFCGHQWTVPKATSLVKCPNCGEMNLFADLSRFRRTP